MLNFAALRAPTEDGGTFVEPAAAKLAELTHANRTLSSRYTFKILDQPVAEVRRTVRASLGLPADALVIATGHQPELIHPGVWAKHIVASRLARALDGVALNLIVDNDAPRAAAFTVPGCDEQTVRTELVPLPGLRPGFAYERRPPLSPRGIADLRSNVARVMGRAMFDESRMPAFFDAAASAEAARDLVDQLTAGRQAVEAPFDIPLHECRVSTAWPNPLTAHLIVDAPRFADRYNAALHRYRRTHRVRGANRPIPDLVCTPDVAELPLWVYGPDEPRRRLFVHTAGPKRTLRADAPDGETIAEFDIAVLGRARSYAQALATLHPRVLRPRALALTLWARLFAADLFIHGIGGAKYDRITDDLIEHYFDVEPPAMACVSATLHLPLPRRPVTIDDWRAAVRRRRDLRYNPQRYVAASPESADLIHRRETAVARSRELRTTDPANHRRRGDVFREIRSLNAALVAGDPTVSPALAEEARRVESDLAANRAALSREYFIGLFSATDLARLCDTLPAVAEL